ncbi:MAG TPA: transglycosylase, partial [Roseateles sp.]|nr:transglycosylase [Roseateles sp.]
MTQPSSRSFLAAAILGLLAACSTTPLPPLDSPPAVTPSRPAALPGAETSRAVLQRERSRWVAADWNELPGWGEDRAAELWPALLRGC